MWVKTRSTVTFVKRYWPQEWAIIGECKWQAVNGHTLLTVCNEVGEKPSTGIDHPSDTTHTSHPVMDSVVVVPWKLQRNIDQYLHQAAPLATAHSKLLGCFRQDVLICGRSPHFSAENEIYFITKVHTPRNILSDNINLLILYIIYILKILARRKYKKLWKRKNLV